MRKYYLLLTLLALLLALASFALMWLNPNSYTIAISLLAVYFPLVAGLQHFFVTSAMNKSPKTFVQVFLGSIVVTLFLHLIVLFAYDITHAYMAKTFTVAFLIGYTVCLIFETVALVKVVQNAKKQAQDSNSSSTK
ncbi:MAG: hypothetical protein IJ761_00035 [Bacteroidales bacterium]|nr:hypothetical protein [Bacteroidales bacterium]